MSTPQGQQFQEKQQPTSNSAQRTQPRAATYHNDYCEISKQINQFEGDKAEPQMRLFDETSRKKRDTQGHSNRDSPSSAVLSSGPSCEPSLTATSTNVPINDDLSSGHPCGLCSLNASFGDLKLYHGAIGDPSALHKLDPLQDNPFHLPDEETSSAPSKKTPIESGRGAIPRTRRSKEAANGVFQNSRKARPGRKEGPSSKNTKVKVGPGKEYVYNDPLIEEMRVASDKAEAERNEKKKKQLEAERQLLESANDQMEFLRKYPRVWRVDEEMKSFSKFNDDFWKERDLAEEAEGSEEEVGIADEDEDEDEEMLDEPRVRMRGGDSTRVDVEAIMAELGDEEERLCCRTTTMDMEVRYGRVDTSFGRLRPVVAAIEAEDEGQAQYFKEMNAECGIKILIMEEKIAEIRDPMGIRLEAKAEQGVEKLGMPDADMFDEEEVDENANENEADEEGEEEHDMENANDFPKLALRSGDSSPSYSPHLSLRGGCMPCIPTTRLADDSRPGPVLHYLAGGDPHRRPMTGKQLREWKKRSAGKGWEGQRGGRRPWGREFLFGVSGGTWCRDGKGDVE